MGQIEAALSDSEIVFVTAGLGGGTACGALPAVVHAARQRGARVIVVATLPFSFEGRRRVAQASEVLASLQSQADLLICIENDRMGEIASARGGAQEAFALVDQSLSQCIRGLAGLAVRRGPLHACFDEVASVYDGADRRGVFGFGEATGDNRAHEAAAALLKSPLLDRGRHFEEMDAALVNIAGGPDMTFHEVQTLAEEVRKQLSDEVETFFGIAVDPALAGRMTVTLLGALPPLMEAPAPVVREVARPAARPPAPTPAPAPVQVAPPPVAPPAFTVVEEVEEEEEVEVLEEFVPEAEQPEEVEAELEEEEAEDEENEAELPVSQETQSLFAEEELPAEEPAAPAPEPVRPRMRPLVAPMGNVRRPTTRESEPEPDTFAETQPKAESEESAKARQLRQSQMQFEAVNRGRFEKSEPTIIDGQDLDVPTFLRRKLKLGQ